MFRSPPVGATDKTSPTNQPAQLSTLIRLASRAWVSRESWVSNDQLVLGCPAILTTPPMDISLPFLRQSSTLAALKLALKPSSGFPQYSWRRKISARWAYGCCAVGPVTYKAPVPDTSIKSDTTNVLAAVSDDFIQNAVYGHSARTHKFGPLCNLSTGLFGYCAIFAEPTAIVDHLIRFRSAGINRYRDGRRPGGKGRARRAHIGFIIKFQPLVTLFATKAWFALPTLRPRKIARAGITIIPGELQRTGIAVLSRPVPSHWQAPSEHTPFCGRPYRSHYSGCCSYSTRHTHLLRTLPSPPEHLVRNPQPKYVSLMLLAHRGKHHQCVWTPEVAHGLLHGQALGPSFTTTLSVRDCRQR